MKYNTLYDKFEKLFPEDKCKLVEIAKMSAADPSDGMHVMFGMVVVPFIMDLLENREEHKLVTAFEYFEKMAESDDPMISEVLEFTVLEDLVSRGKNILDKCKKYMGKNTLESCLKVEKYLL